MKKLFFPLLFIALYCCANAQTDNKIILGHIDTINSKILKEQRKIWIYIPNGGTNKIESGQHYPVVYLLDGSLHFYSVSGIIKQLSSSNGNTICPEMIVVGIVNTNRTRDLTPTHNITDPPFSQNKNNNSGGGKKFLSFIEKELIPHIDSLYPVSPYRMLIGHSFGGLMAIYTLIHHSHLFNSYVAIEPSMWWDNTKILKETGKALAEKNFDGISLYLGIANTMPDGMDTTSVITRHIRAILELNKYLNSYKQNGLRFKSRYYSTDNHISVPLIAEYDALHFIFDYYPLKITFHDYTDTTAELVSKIKKHFEKISTKMGYKVLPPERMINSMGYISLGRKFYKKAAAFFKLNVDDYPGSSNVYDSFGDYYNTIGDKENAVFYYQKALAITDNAYTKQKLEKLQEQGK